MAIFHPTSGQLAKNLGQTIINAGNTPTTNDETNNLAGFGVLTGNNSGKSSGSKPVQRVGIPVSSGIGTAGPGIQTVVFHDPFAGSPLGQVIGKTFTWRDKYTGRLPVRWNHIYSKYPRPAQDTSDGVNYCFNFCANVHGAHCRSDDDLFGTNVSLTNSTNGISIAIGSPSGVNAAAPQRAEYAYTKNRREGHVIVDEFNLKGRLGEAGAASVGHITKDGFALRGNEDDWMSCGVGILPKRLCSEVTPGFDAKGQRLRYMDGGPFGDRLTDYPKHTMTASGTGFGQSVTFNANGSRMAVGAPYADDNRGEVTVYQYVSSSGVGGEWIRVGAPIVSPNDSSGANGLHRDRFGWDVALDGDGENLWVGAPRPGGTGYVAHFSLQGTDGADGCQHPPGGVTWKKDNHGGSVSGINPNDRFGYSVSCNRSGNAVAVGSPWASGTRGTVEVYHRTGIGGSTVDLWKKLKRSNGSAQRIVGTASGEMAGWSVSMMYDSLPSTTAGRYNPMIAVGSPFYSRTVDEFDSSRWTAAQRAAGVPIYDGSNVGGGGSQDAIDQRALNIGFAYDKLGLTCEGRVTVWQFNQVGAARKHHYGSLEWLPKGKYSGRKLLVGKYPQSEMGYSVAFTKTGDYLAVGCPGTDGRFDIADCEQLTAIGERSVGASPEGYVLYAGPGGDVEAADPNDYRYKYVYKPDGRGKDCYEPNFRQYLFNTPEGRSYVSEYGIGSVKVFRYIWEGKDGEDARQEHALHSSRQDVWIKYGPTLPGVPIPNYDKDWVTRNRALRYERPNFQDLDGKNVYPRFSNEERFGTDVSIIDVNIPIVAVGAPYAEDERYNCLHKELGGYHRPTGRVDIYSSTPTRQTDNVMPFGAGGLQRSTPKNSSRTKPKFQYGPDGGKVASSGGGQESFFTAPNVSGSGLSDDNALKTSRKTFNSGGINFTSSD